MIHGLATNLAFWGMRHAPFFAKRYRVTIYDLRGHGRTEMPASGYTPEEMVADLRALLDHLEIRQAHFVGHSFGGIIGLKFACLEPERVLSLVLADTHITAARNLQKDYRWEAGDKYHPILRENNLALDTQHPYFGYQLLTEVSQLQLAGYQISERLRELIGPLTGMFGKRTAKKWLELMNTTAAEQEMMGNDDISLQSLGGFKFPLLGVYGEQSHAMLTGKQLSKVCDTSELRIIQEAGHFFPLTRAEVFFACCLSFWDGVHHDKLKQRRSQPSKNVRKTDRFYA